MIERTVPISEAKARLSALVNRVAYSGERVILQSHGRPKAALVGLEDLHALQSGGRSARVRTARLAGLRRIETLTRRVRRDLAGRTSGDASADLSAVRKARIADLDRLR